jgi:hypothetical protein
LLTPGPAVLVKAAWYQTQLFHVSVLGICLLVFLLTMVVWLLSLIRTLRKRQTHPLFTRLARTSGTVFIVLLIVFLAGVAYLVSQVDFVSGTPLFVLEVPTLLPLVLIIPPAMVVTGFLLLIFTLLAWVKRLWNFGARLHYTLLTIAAWTMLCELVYWNFLKI